LMVVSIALPALVTLCTPPSIITPDATALLFIIWVPPLSITVPISVPPTPTFSVPPFSIVPLMAVPSPTISYPPLKSVVALAVPVEMIWWAKTPWPLEPPPKVALTAVPPKRVWMAPETKLASMSVPPP
jgi:hypothetical protein